MRIDDFIAAELNNSDFATAYCEQGKSLDVMVTFYKDRFAGISQTSAEGMCDGNVCTEK